MHKLVEFIVKNLVSKPELVLVHEVEVNGKKILQIKVASADIAKVIGSGGRVFRALRAVIQPSMPDTIRDVIVNVADA